eukprot:Clim_evm122s109 gene=Clim_evmTU122s109
MADKELMFSTLDDDADVDIVSEAETDDGYENKHGVTNDTSSKAKSKSLKKQRAKVVRELADKAVKAREVLNTNFEFSMQAPQVKSTFLFGGYGGTGAERRAPVDDNAVDVEFSGSSDGEEDDNDNEGGWLQNEGEENENEDEEDMETDSADEDDEDDEADIVKPSRRANTVGVESTGDNSDDDDDEEFDEAKEAAKRAFFDTIDDTKNATLASSFKDLHLSRPILKACDKMKLKVPTPVQSACVPVALQGRDICACAETGSGKTAAYLLPILERLLFRQKQEPATRCLVVCPTRELAVQVHEAVVKFTEFTDVTSCLVVGGTSEQQQAAVLRQYPDLVVATPGRLIDHVMNTPGFHLEALECLIFDEADRLLELGFKDEVDEIVKYCGRNHQTMLFSATMTDEVDDLINLSLQNPVRLFINRNREVAVNVVQEFVRIKQTREADREAILLALLRRSFRNKPAIVFFRTKKQAQRMRLLCKLLGLRAAELHGSLSQNQRLENLRQFKENEVNVLIATDLAARGLDIEGIEVVLNASMPPKAQQYIHRVGRTGRAGRRGLSVTLVGESDRKVLKTVLRRKSVAGKTGKVQARSRTVPQSVIDKYCAKIASLEPKIVAAQEKEREESLLVKTEMELRKAENLLVHGDEIRSRPKKEWFQTSKEKAAAHKADLAANAGAALAIRKDAKAQKRGQPKLAPEEAKALRTAKASARKEKRSKRQGRIHGLDESKPITGIDFAMRRTTGSGGRANGVSGPGGKKRQVEGFLKEVEKLGSTKRKKPKGKGAQSFKSRKKHKRR